MFYLWPQSQENAKNSFRETSLKNDSIAKINVLLDAEHAFNSRKVILNMRHLVLFLASGVCRVMHFPYSYFPHHKVSEPFFTISKITVI